MNLNEWVNTYINEISEDEKDPQEITVGNYQTKYFHVCPGASTLYKDIESKGVDMDMAERSARLQDALYFVEEHIQRDGYEPDKDYVMVANNIAKNIMKMAKLMGLEEEHNYIQGHVDTIEKVVKEKGLEESIMNLTEKNTPTDPSKWAYYKAQAKKKFDVYPSAYANRWAAKKYKAAGGGWRKSESVVNESSISIDKKVTNIINSRDFKKFVNYFNSFYGKNGIYSSGKDISEKDIMKGLYNVFKRNNSYEWGDGDSVDRELVRDELFKMKVLSDKIYKNEALSVKEATPEEEDEFHRNLDKLVHKTFGHSSDEEKMNEANEPDIISQLRDIVSKKQNQKLKDPKSGKTMRVDLYSASAVTQVYDALKQQSNKDKFVSMGLVGMVNMAFKLINKQEIVEYDVETLEELNDFHQFMKEYKSDINEAEYQGRKVELGKIMQGDVKKFKVYVKNDKGNVVKVNFGQGGDAKGGTMRIRKNNPEARKSFRARHNCDNPGPRWKARYWSCRKW
jgi:hypothetical protein